MKVLKILGNRSFLVVSLSAILSFLFVFLVVSAATTISTNISTGGTLSVTGASTLTGNTTVGGTLGVTGASTLTGNTTVAGTLGVTGLTSLGQASSTRFSVFDTAYFGGTSTTTIDSEGNISVASGEVGASKTRATGATGSFQAVWGDTTYQGAAGTGSFYHAGMMGNFLGDTLTNTEAVTHAGVIGKYSVTTGDDIVGTKAGLVGELETDIGDFAVAAILGGDTGAITPRAAYGIQYFNSTAASKFDFGLDLFHAETTGYTNSAVDFGTADIRLQNGETISNGTDGTITTSGYLVKSVNTALTALAGGAQAGTALTADINVVTTVATAGDSVQLPVAVSGMEIRVINRTVTSLNVFGQTGDGINGGGANVAYAVAGNVEAICTTTGAAAASVWECQKLSR